LLDRVGEPYPYVACLVADGDRMGHAIDALASAEDHRKLSHGLAGFAKEARQIVEQQHRGSLVYAGGDDVLAFLPLPEALACADALRCSFATTMQAVTCGRPGGAPPTLSVGLGIGHVMESMGTLLKLGRDAEELAKRGPGGSDGRNALAIIVDKRSGGQRSWWARWEPRADGPDPVERLRKDAAHGTGGEQPVAVRLDPVERLHKDAALLADGGPLSTRKVYQIARTLQRLPAPAHASEPGWGWVLSREVRRSLSRVDADGGVEPAAVGLRLETAADHATLAVTPDYAALHAEVSAWINRLLIARTFAMARPPRGEDGKS
jgi:CRISPR-associated protein Cmr2